MAQKDQAFQSITLGHMRSHGCRRGLKPLRLKLNPIWWFGNDDEQKVDDGSADWYHPEWPRWRRKLYWNFFRNPLMNFRNYVIGFADRDYMVSGKDPVMTIQRDDLVPPDYGWQWSYITLKSGWRLPFCSYSGKRLVLQLGWQPCGYFMGIKLNWRKTPWGQGSDAGYSHVKYVGHEPCSRCSSSDKAALTCGRIGGR
jgi:hypothetical protein